MIAVNPDRTRCPYEVGDILQTINSTPPALRWPGTQWQQITDRFVRGADAQHRAGSTGGSWQHFQTVEEMPSHGHQIRTYQYAPGASDHQLINSGHVPSQYAEFWSTATGGGQAMDITNPYYSAYIWLRTG